MQKLNGKGSFFTGVVLTLFVCLGIFFYYGEKKEIMFCDEVYTYTVANVHGVHLAVRDNKWYTASEMDKRFSSIEGYKFKDVRIGTGNDVSPPIYYNSFKAVAATFPTSTSKWLGFGTNLISFIPFLVLLYWGIWEITKKPLVAMMFTILLGVNQGMQGVALLIRMYMLFAVCLLIFFMQTKVLNDNRGRLASYIGLGITTFVGFMTHYYFAMYVAVFSAFFVLSQLLTRKWKQILAYLGTMAAAVGAATVYFPQWIGHFFYSDKGNVSLDTLTNWNGFREEITVAFHQIGEFVFAHHGNWYWIILLMICIFFFSVKNSELTDMKKHCGMHLTAQICYYGVIAHTMPSPEVRYYWAVIILQCIMAIYMLVCILKSYALLEKKMVIAVLLLITIIYTAMFPMRMDDVPYHGAEYKEGRLLMEKYEQTPWIIYGEKDWVMHSPAFDFLIPEKLMFIEDASTVGYDEVLQNSNEIVLYVRNDEDLNATIEQLENVSGRNYSYNLLAERSYNDAYLITRE